MVYVKQISGTHFPSFKGRLAVVGTYGGHAAYQRGMSAKWVWFDVVSGGYVISNVKGTRGKYAFDQDTPSTNPDGTYHATGTRCEGTPAVSFYSDSELYGLIVMWHGSIASIPKGWVLCDGTNGTPDLRGKFVPCAYSTLPAGSTGGTSTHGHNFNFALGGSLAAGNNLLTVTPAGNFAVGFTGGGGGFTDPAGTLPPFYALAYIMHI